jgi:hypothetical protein
MAQLEQKMRYLDRDRSNRGIFLTNGSDIKNEHIKSKLIPARKEKITKLISTYLSICLSAVGKTIILS